MIVNFENLKSLITKEQKEFNATVIPEDNNSLMIFHSMEEIIPFGTFTSNFNLNWWYLLP